MIGVVGDAADQDVIREFFELFKTPWEFYREGQHYDVILCAGDYEPGATSQVLIYYAASRTRFDDRSGFRTGPQRSHPCKLSYQVDWLPIYRNTIAFPEEEKSRLSGDESGNCVAFVRGDDTRVVARVGYDLFGEVRRLLEEGQPIANAQIPALEMHIGFLRDLITGCGVTLFEVPPVPEGYQFIVCLTHDVDHPLVGRHKWDRTMVGFLYRAIFGSVRNFMRGRISARNLLSNWTAALKLPFVYLGLAKDFWSNFAERYLALEKDLASTFFIIPFEGRSGNKQDGRAPNYRAAGYGARDLEGTIQRLVSAGCEIGLHGIDAWLDPSKGQEELNEIRRLTGAQEIGVRMHWLYFDQQSPRVLEKPEAAYDSTVGYNQTIGYKAGTTQVYKPLNATHLLELPLHVMDTAMFYPDYLNLSPLNARALLAEVVEDAARYGGCLTINWHDRSLAPERQWDAPYRELIQNLRLRGAWFATASQAVTWFRMRRSIGFTADGSVREAPRVIEKDRSDHLPGLRLRVHRKRQASEGSTDHAVKYVDFPLGEKANTSAFCGVTN